jgi:hypothetical protein
MAPGGVWRRPQHRLVVGVGLLLLTVISYFAWLGWDQQKTAGPDGSLHGPYATWQVVGFVITTVACAVVAGWQRIPILGSVVISAAITILWCIDAANDSESDGLWPVGGILVTGGATAGTVVAGMLAAELLRRRNL